MNQYEITSANSAMHECPNVRKGVKLLYNLMLSINNQSDGWAYWKVGYNAAKSLITLLKRAGNLPYGTSGKLTDAELRKAITPIRRMVTVQKKKQAKYGNTFDFDVDAALS